ncbi:MAG: DNA gyrase/topoisomerase IV subunit A [Bacteroidota bacterium]
MSEEQNNQNGQDDPSLNGHDNVITLSGMYEDYFLDYASYVILERAVPAIGDGLKPVQRRILHALKTMDDGRFHKVANVIGQTMAYHPHGDAAIGAALVHLGQKELLFDCQGNWGDTRTGDPAAAARYIEVRLSKFALDVVFNPQTTEWQLTYDGRKKEPVTLPVKFPLLLSQGADGIAVGLSTKILPHNFIEIIRASIKVLKGMNPKIYPDFLEGGSIDVSNYNGGKRGGKVRIRSKIEQIDKKTLVIKEIPYGTNTGSLIDSIIKANDKGKIKIKKVTDNTAKDVEILIDLPPGVSPDVTIDALYAFTNCEISVSPNACIIVDDKPHFLSVNDVLKISTENTKGLLKLELEIKLNELQEKWHFASLEKIFIQNRIYREIEECETWEAVIETIDSELKKYVDTPSTKNKSKDRFQLNREITKEDIVRLTEIKIKRISKYNSFKADELIAGLEEGIKETEHHLAHLIEFAISYFETLLDKYGKGRERRTEITEFDDIKVRQVVANNRKLYINRKEGFIGYGLKKDEFISDCSDISDIIVFLKSGKFMVTRIAEKVFVGKDILHANVWKKGDKRTTYHLAYVDGKSGKSFVKRFNVSAITRDRPYDLTKGTPRSKVHYFSCHPNGEAESVTVQLSQGCSARKKVFDFEFGDLAIKGRASQGNVLTKYPVRKITQNDVGKSTLGAQNIWIDDASGRLNTVERGNLLGAFDTGDQILAIYTNGSYELTSYELTNRYDPKTLLLINKFDPEAVISALYYDADKKASVIKRFKIETSKQDQKFGFIGENSRSSLLFVSTDKKPIVSYKVKTKKGTKEHQVNMAEFIEVKGWKALGNKLGDFKAMSVKPFSDEEKENDSPGSNIEFEITNLPDDKKTDDNGQQTIF